MFSLRAFSPALLDTSALSCIGVSRIGARFICVTPQILSADNKNIKVNPVFENRNPRALEAMGLERKPKGWKFQSPRKDYYHKLIFDKKNMKASIVHKSGKVVVEASTSEPTIMKHLYNPRDVSAAWNLGQILSRRMLESGLTSVFFDHQEDSEQGSEKRKAFFSALEENAIQLEEPEEVEFEHVPGVNYEGYNRYGEKKRYKDDYQKL